MKISMIACVTSDMCIGVDNRLLVPLKPDMNHFKLLTTGHVIVMGRKTYESLPNVLPNRTNVIISSTMTEAPEKCQLYHSVDEFMEAYRDYDGEVFIIGGATLYDQFMPYASKIYLTHVHRDGITLLNNNHFNYTNLVKFPSSVCDYDWDFQKSVDEVCIDRQFGIVHFNFLTLVKR